MARCATIGVSKFGKVSLAAFRGTNPQRTRTPGHHPLLFLLKCLEADDARLPELIRDEIQAGTFFALCNTRASRRSKWVKQEILGGR